MAIVTWASMEQFVAGRLPDIPVLVLQEELRIAARKFYAETRTWRDAAPREIIAATVVDQALYTVSGSPTEAELAGVCAAWANNTKLIEVRNEETEDSNDDDAGPPTSGNPTHIRVASVTQVRLLPAPNATSWVVKASLAYRPTIASTGIDDTLFYEHYEAIVELVVSTCAMHERKPWSNPRAAAVAQAEYRRLALEFSTRAGSVGRRLRTRVHSF